MFRQKRMFRQKNLINSQNDSGTFLNLENPDSDKKNVQTRKNIQIKKFNKQSV